MLNRPKQPRQHAVLEAILFVSMVVIAVSLYIAHFARRTHSSQLSPAGTIARDQQHLMYVVAGIVLAVAVPTIVLLYFMAWKYRETNAKATYRSETKNSRSFVVMIWGIPIVTILLLAAILVPVTHRLNPKTQAANGKAPITIQVIALRWKWLFLYPDQHIATVNTITIPKDQPISFELTADDAPMSSFWIPKLSGQLYAMTGHVNHLNMVASTPGTYTGSSAEINGAGFADMTFAANVTTYQEFASWVDAVKTAPNQLSQSDYDALMKPSEKVAPSNYSGYADDLYNKVVMKYMSHMEHAE